MDYLELSREDAVRFLEALSKYFPDVVDVAKRERIRLMPAFETANRRLSEFRDGETRDWRSAPAVPTNPYELDMVTLLQMARDREERERYEREIETHVDALHGARAALRRMRTRMGANALELADLRKAKAARPAQESETKEPDVAAEREIRELEDRLALLIQQQEKEEREMDMLLAQIRQLEKNIKAATTASKKLA